MKVLPLAANHIVLELDNGELVDVNDGTSPNWEGHLSLRLVRYSSKYDIQCKQDGERVAITFERRMA